MSAVTGAPMPPSPHKDGKVRNEAKLLDRCDFGAFQKISKDFIAASLRIHALCSLSDLSF
jgi:hypothetical protein